MILALLLSLLPLLVEQSIYVYHTEDSPSVEYYDCLRLDHYMYCRRPGEPVRLERDLTVTQCWHQGIRHSFESMKADNISVSTVLHEWKSTLEVAERYSQYRQYSLLSTIQNQNYLCQCVEPGSFGKNCEYKLPTQLTFDQSSQWQLSMMKAHQPHMQLYGDILCYTTLECHSGLLCLDWRDICDGIQQCMFGLDEANCDKLEFNECEDDEYRCMNGMCIPDSAFVDGDYDCMDLTDEKGSANDGDCTFQYASFECDERVCLPGYWSCGDGQCIKRRLAFQDEVPSRAECKSRRDQHFMCEMHGTQRLWTLPNGRCHSGEGYRESRVQPRSPMEQCMYAIKCALSEGLEGNCPHKHNPTLQTSPNSSCPTGFIQYPPNGSIIAPYITLFYHHTHDWSKPLPDLVRINGTIKCRGYTVHYQGNGSYFSSDFTFLGLEWRLCQPVTKQTIVHTDGYDRFCYNDSTTFNGQRYHEFDVCRQSRECISAYRVEDSFKNCADKQDEGSSELVAQTCTKVKRHRFQCSKDDAMCLHVTSLGDTHKNCKNCYDESYMGTGATFQRIHCNGKWKEDCALIRDYIAILWTTDSVSVYQKPSTKAIPFRSYCDTFWDYYSKSDEDLAECQRWWICLDGQWRCRTGQCIDVDWVLDGEWDCFDASDEIAFLFNDHHLSAWNANLRDQSVLLSNYTSIYMPGFSRRECNVTTHFDCFVLNATSAVDIISTQRMYCLSLEKVGDGRIDCLGGLDEQNTVEHCDRATMLGNHFKCVTSNTCIPYSQVCKKRCPDAIDDTALCGRNDPPSGCTEKDDQICFDGTCAKHGWCDGTPQCSNREDEYNCEQTASESNEHAESYHRRDKENSILYEKQPFKLPVFPSDAGSRPMSNSIRPSTIQEPINTLDSTVSSSSSVAYACNRGFGILSHNGSVVCFCPQSYYGHKCQYHSDRLTLFFRVNYSRSIYGASTDVTFTLKMLVIFLFNNQPLDSYEFHIRPSTSNLNSSRKLGHVLYSRSKDFLTHKRSRFSNRSAITDDHPYAVRVEAFDIHAGRKPRLVGVWQYTIHFDFLPVFRLVKTLHLYELGSLRSPCLRRPCGLGEQCHPLLNNLSSYVCLCPGNYKGENCSELDQVCATRYCSPNAVCKPNYRGLLNRNELPYCVCPHGFFGAKCELEYEQCKSNPCENNGTCFPMSTLGRFICLCNAFYEGDHCQLEKEAVRLYVQQSSAHRAAVVQFLDVELSELTLTLIDQRFYNQLPKFLSHLNSDTRIIDLVVAKLYSGALVRIYLLAIHLNIASINATTVANESNRCMPVRELFSTNDSKQISPMMYHHVCRNHTALLCFHDDKYLCICEERHLRVDCFVYDQSLDQCSRCLAGGRCLQGDRARLDDFHCLCPPCTSGRFCEFSSKSFSFTFDQLFSANLVSKNVLVKNLSFYSILIGGWLTFLVGLLNNTCSFVTFRRPKCRRNGVGQYLLATSVVNQISLTLLACRLTHLTINMTSYRAYPLLDTILCSALHYLGNACNRVAYWLVALIAIERVYTIVFLNRQGTQRAVVARRLILGTCATMLAIGAYETVFIRSYPGFNDGKSSICVLEFPANDRMWIVIHQVVTMVNALVPVAINICCMVVIIYVVVEKKMTINRTDNRQ